MIYDRFRQQTPDQILRNGLQEIGCEITTKNAVQIFDRARGLLKVYQALPENNRQFSTPRPYYEAMKKAADVMHDAYIIQAATPNSQLNRSYGERRNTRAAVMRMYGDLAISAVYWHPSNTVEMDYTDLKVSTPFSGFHDGIGVFGAVNPASSYHYRETAPGSEEYNLVSSHKYMLIYSRHPDIDTYDEMFVNHALAATPLLVTGLVCEFLDTPVESITLSERRLMRIATTFENENAVEYIESDIQSFAHTLEGMKRLRETQGLGYDTHELQNAFVHLVAIWHSLVEEAVKKDQRNMIDRLRLDIARLTTIRDIYNFADMNGDGTVLEAFASGDALLYQESANSKTTMLVGMYKECARAQRR